MAVVKKRVQSALQKAKIKAHKALHHLGFDPAYYDLQKHGVTFSLLTKWTNCRERARLHLLGWTPRRQGISSIFGTIIHAALERMYGDIQSGTLTAMPFAKGAIPKYLTRIVGEIEAEWKKENPGSDSDTMQQVEIACAVAETVLTHYCIFWREDANKIEWLKLEHQFVRPRTIQLSDKWKQPVEIPVRGKMDGTFRQGKSKRTKLFETKTKSRLGEAGESNLVDILSFEMQANLYLTVIEDVDGKKPDALLYNIIRRPGMQMKKGETFKAFQDRLAKDMMKRPEYYFIRLRMTVDPAELDHERSEHTAKITDFAAWYHGEAGHYKNSDHCENKYGTCEFLAICGRKDFSGFYKRPTVFRELEDV